MNTVAAGVTPPRPSTAPSRSARRELTVSFSNERGASAVATRKVSSVRSMDYAESLANYAQVLDSGPQNARRLLATIDGLEN